MTKTSRTGTHQRNKHKAKNRLVPIQSVTLVTPEGIRSLSVAHLTPSSIGHKGFGLACLPSGWTAPFFIIDSRCVPALQASSDPICEQIRRSIREAIEQIRPTTGDLLVVRSSGSAETLSRRGSLFSADCRVDQVVATLQELNQKIALENIERDSSPVHWVVQLKSNTRMHGHASNERRLRAESRDWVAEVEDAGGAHGPRTEYFAVRQWRDGKPTLGDRLTCKHANDLPDALKQVAQWAMQFKDRLHFEWVWGGSLLHVVQIDVEETPKGIDPRKLLPTRAVPIASTSLRRFRTAEANDLANYAKLRNVALYEKLGYEMPRFYILDQADVIRSILDGQIPSDIAGDLEELTARPLMIRVDGTAVPEDKREMLPRSDELRNFDAALTWMRERLAVDVDRDGLRDAGLCLIAHQFVPAVASAWARAEPGDRWVRIESLWGVPEGLYWYSHDTFEVDTLVADPNQLASVTPERFKVRARPRYKGIFVAPNHTGEWVTHTTRPPHDWARSIQKEDWIREIALATRKIAIHEHEPTTVMWFVDVHADASANRVIPWFHGKAESSGNVRAAPRRKISTHSDYVVRNHADWEELQKLLADRSIDRVRVEPLEPALVRNRHFAERIADLAKERGFVIELAGGVLSHIYYVLTRKGCRVECVDLYGVDEETLRFNKIVRDQIPDQIQKGGERATVVKLKGEILTSALKQKLIEEALEVCDASERDEIKTELADALEVLTAIGARYDFTLDDIQNERERKKRKRGGFEKGLMLVQTSTPHTLSPTDSLMLSEELVRRRDSDSPPIAESSAEAGRLAVKPDLRSIGNVVEKLITFAADLPSLSKKQGRTVFRVPISAHETGPEVSLEIELRRSKSELRGAIRIRGLPTQYSFEFDMQ